METPIITSLVALAGVCFTAWLGFLAARLKSSEKRLEQAEDELQWQSNAISFTNYLGRMAPIAAEMQAIMEATNIDRIIVFRAWNGWLEPRWTTAVFKLTSGSKTPFHYVHWELDEDYRDRLRHIDKHGHAYYSVDDMGDCAIKSLYTAEGVTASLWTHIAHLDTEKKDKKALIYASFATHKGALDHRTITQCLVIANQLRGALLG